MQNDFIKQWTQLSKKANESLKKMNSLNTSSIKELTKLQMEMVSSCLEGSMKKAQHVGSVSSVSDLMNLQSDLYKELTEKILNNAQRSVKLAMETKEAMGELINEGMAIVEEPSEVVKKPAAKPRATRKPKATAAAKPKTTATAKRKPVTKRAATKPRVKPAEVVTAKKVSAAPVSKAKAPKPIAATTNVDKTTPDPAVKMSVQPSLGLSSTEGDSKK